MIEISDDFLEVLSTHTKVWERSDLSDTPWEPSLGDYTCLLDKLVQGTKLKDGVTRSWVRVVFKIIGGDSEGRTISDFFWFAPNSPATWRFPKLAQCVSGRRPTTIGEATAILREAEGSVEFKLRVHEYTSKKTGEKGRSIRYLGRVKAAE